jgi:hypothetical protein
MKITVSDLISYLSDYDDEAEVKFAMGSFNNTTIVGDYGFISESNSEVYGKEIVIHPYVGDRYAGQQVTLR